MTLPVEYSWKNTGAKIETNSYTGDGSTTGREIDIGFQPDYLYVQKDRPRAFTTFSTTGSQLHGPALADAIQTTTSVKLSTNGFTVGDGDTEGNVNNDTYHYFAIQLTGNVEGSWKDTRWRIERDTYTGDGSTTGREISVGDQAQLLLLHENDSRDDQWYSVGRSTEGSPAATAHLQAGGTFEVEQDGDVHPSSDGFTVGDGSASANVNNQTYTYLVLAPANASLGNTVDASWKNDRLQFENGEYTGDGGTTGRQIATGFACDIVWVQQGSNAELYTTMNLTNSIETDAGEATATDAVNNVHLHSTDGFTVGDGGSEGNANNDSYQYFALGIN